MTFQPKFVHCLSSHSKREEWQRHGETKDMTKLTIASRNYFAKASKRPNFGKINAFTSISDADKFAQSHLIKYPTGFTFESLLRH